MPGTVTRPEGLEVKAASASPESGLIAADDATGVVEAIVSVTGIRDEVDDVIVPGAYADTLARRTPKGIFVHDWGRWAARTEHIEELLPGDPRLPKMTKDGQPWPQEAGGLYVKARYNLATSEGRDAYANIKFFSETGECDWSIGFKVPKGGAVRTKDGARHIQTLDLYEYSPVLFGAAGPFSGTLSVKSLGGPDDEDGLGEEELHAEAVPLLSPEDVDAPGEGGGDEGEVKAGAPGVADTPKDKAAVARLKRWYVRGEGAAKIRWGTPGDFMRCVDLASKHMTPEHAKGFCQLRHKDALGKYAGQERGKKDALPEGEPVYPFLEGTFEEVRDRVAEAATKALGGFVDVIGTWPDHAVVIHHPAGGGAEPLDVPFTLDAEGKAVLGEVEPVTLSVEGGGEVSGGEDLLPYPAMVEDLTMSVKSLLHAETKAGRVLSGANVVRLKSAVEHLVSVLEAAGVEIGEPDEKPEPKGEPARDSSAPSAQIAAPEGKVILPPDVLARGYRLIADTRGV